MAMIVRNMAADTARGPPGGVSNIAKLIRLSGNASRDVAAMHSTVLSDLHSPNQVMSPSFQCPPRGGPQYNFPA